MWDAAHSTCELCRNAARPEAGSSRVRVILGFDIADKVEASVDPRQISCVVCVLVLLRSASYYLAPEQTTNYRPGESLTSRTLTKGDRTQTTGRQTCNRIISRIRVARAQGKF